MFSIYVHVHSNKLAKGTKTAVQEINNKALGNQNQLAMVFKLKCMLTTLVQKISANKNALLDLNLY